MHDTSAGASIATPPVAWNSERARAWIAVPDADDDKYSRGVLGVVTGSAEYPGAAVLGVEAAIRTGVGMVRYLGDPPATRQVLARRPEAVPGDGRVEAWLVGSGMDADTRGAEATDRVRRALATGAPVVLDAGALDMVRQATGPTLILPHARELARLLNRLGSAAPGAAGDGEVVSAAQVSADPVGWAHRAVRATGAVVLLKGSRTVVASMADGVARTIILPPGTSWLATAGTGDVLGGIIGALVATHSDIIGSEPAALAEIAATGALIHGLAAAFASGGGPIAALDIAEAVPGRIAALLA
ncbi:ADP/ATP-dependent (S)-NAD(P)H-hydrate dehydratase [Homoserinimonas sp. OAct 916]|uniref:ADP-dependent NAD(P)H-hydrate dehydratase n=1 Tax=Homoserinimonas sp. OAct 916 TaxID=2211450 RepID=UPI000DBDFFAD|nr:ADP/ATP-dependent (S)-NAD(P)H-hydrate dehydratase [Homoserinimonas sp. OAct 916]